jgi:sporulation protein YlmC with PRC-barrel domain
MRLSYEEQVRGRTVIDASGSSVGEVDSLYLDAESIDRRFRRLVMRSS